MSPRSSSLLLPHSTHPTFFYFVQPSTPSRARCLSFFPSISLQILFSSARILDGHRVKGFTRFHCDVHTRSRTHLPPSDCAPVFRSSFVFPFHIDFRTSTCVRHATHLQANNKPPVTYFAYPASHSSASFWLLYLYQPLRFS